MKKRISTILTALVLVMILVMTMVACNKDSGTDSDDGNGSTSDTGSNNGGNNNGGNNNGGDNTSDGGNTNTELASYKTSANSKLDEIINPLIAKIPDEELKAAIQAYYDAEKVYINGITDIEEAKAAVTKVVEDTKVFAVTTFKPLVIQKINSAINPLIGKISDESLKASVQSFYNTEMAKIDAADDLDDFVNLYKEILDDTKNYIKTETEKILIALKNKALEELDPYITALINKIPYEPVKTDTQAFYQTEKAKLQAVDTIEGVTPCVNEIKSDLEAYALEETKKVAVARLKEVVDAGIAKIPNPEIKADLQAFANKETAKLNAVTDITLIPSTLTTVIEETEAHIRSLLISTVKDYIARLAAVETATAYDYIPDAMKPTYSLNLVDNSDINYDFTSSTGVSSINQAGYGEQWQMVIENVEQSVQMAKVFNIVQTTLSAATNAVDIYLTNSYADEMSYNFSGDGYVGVFEFSNGKLLFRVDITKSVNVPIAGSVQPKIIMEYDLAKDAKAMFISLGDAYKIKYLISDNAYEMATTYGITIGGNSASRASYLSITKVGSKTVGHIYEYTTINDSDKINACADFYIENGYVSVVGNKASGMVAFDGYVNELYSASQGRLLGYEVREELTVAGVTGTYNTLWFNLWDISGINSVKVLDKSDTNPSGKSTCDVYLNGSSSLLSPAYNSKLGVKTSRKYDIEYRMRYYYSYDAANDKYVVTEVEVPMMFIQEGDNFSSFSQDIMKNNGIQASVSLNTAHLNKILSDYDTLIDIFIENKDKMSSDVIEAYLNY